jgi:beta-galactosidase
LGPGESYSDKCDSVHVDIFQKKILALDYSYDVPQENGNHSGTRWIWIGKLQLVEFWLL